MRFKPNSEEDRVQYTNLLDALRAEHRPVTPTEDSLVEEIAAAHWRIRHADHDESRLSLSKALAQLRALRVTFTEELIRSHREDVRDERHRLRDYRLTPMPGVRATLAPISVLPPHLRRELAWRLRRDPGFNPRTVDAAELSPALRKWFENHRETA